MMDGQDLSGIQVEPPSQLHYIPEDVGYFTDILLGGPTQTSDQTGFMSPSSMTLGHCDGFRREEFRPFLVCDQCSPSQ